MTAARASRTPNRVFRNSSGELSGIQLWALPDVGAQRRCRFSARGRDANGHASRRHGPDLAERWPASSPAIHHAIVGAGLCVHRAAPVVRRGRRLRTRGAAARRRCGVGKAPLAPHVLYYSAPDAPKSPSSPKGVELLFTGGPPFPKRSSCGGTSCADARRNGRHAPTGNWPSLRAGEGYDGASMAPLSKFALPIRCRGCSK